MAQHLLNNTQIRSVFQKMRGEGMTQDMRENMLFQSCGSGAVPGEFDEPAPSSTDGRVLSERYGFSFPS